MLLGQERQRLVDWMVPHLQVDKLKGTTGEQDIPCNPGFQRGDVKPQNLSLKTRDCSGGRNSHHHSGVQWRDPQGPRMYTTTHLGIRTRRAHFVCG